MRFRLFFLLFILPLSDFAQPVLHPSIGIGTLPADTATVCPIPWYLGSFYSSGLQAGDTAYDFTLYDLNGDSLSLEEALSHGRPVLLVAASYTCPVYRGKVPVINDVVTTYSGQLDVYIIYTIEAHPDSDTSVYFGYVNPTTANINQGILYGQPVTYGERKNIVSDMLSQMNILAPVYIDGPCNNWWLNYGPAPNNAYLIDTTGIVYAKHGWFDRFPDNIYCDIDSLLGTVSGHCTGVGGNSSFVFQMNSADTVPGPAGTTISVDGELANTGNDDILVYAQRILNELPSTWETSMCIDVCYPASTDSVVFLLPAGTVQPVHVYFYSSLPGPDTGYVRMGFRNIAHPNNDTAFDAVAISETTSMISSQEFPLFSVFPNPATGEINLRLRYKQEMETSIMDATGCIVLRTKNQEKINLSGLPPGLYIVQLRAGNQFYFRKFIKASGAGTPD